MTLCSAMSAILWSDFLLSIYNKKSKLKKISTTLNCTVSWFIILHFWKIIGEIIILKFLILFLSTLSVCFAKKKKKKRKRNSLFLMINSFPYVRLMQISNFSSKFSETNHFFFFLALICIMCYITLVLLDQFLNK